MPAYVFQQTLQYSTFIKRAVVEALREAFNDHPAKTVAQTQVSVNLPLKQSSFPSVVIKFYERQMPNAGVGHSEYLVSPDDPHPEAPTLFIKYYHRMYKGDISFDIYALAAPDRDLVRDALIEVLSMQELTTQGSLFIHRLYNFLNETPYGQWHFPVLNLDLITGYGEQEGHPGWSPEDRLIYQVSYRVPIFGEFYSNTPSLPSAVGLVQEVDVYPWIAGTDPEPTDPPLGGDPDGYYHYTGNDPDDETI